MARDFLPLQLNLTLCVCRCDDNGVIKHHRREAQAFSDGCCGWSCFQFINLNERLFRHNDLNQNLFRRNDFNRH